jgi:hypothetical protein
MAAPTFGFSGRKIDYQDAPITNGVAFWPDLNLKEFQESRSIPPDLPASTAARAVLAAIGEVNDYLASVVSRHVASGYTDALAVPGAVITGEGGQQENQLTAQYKKAVYARAKADLLGEFPTIGRRDTQPGAESGETHATLLAEAAFVLRNMAGFARVGVYMI